MSLIKQEDGHGHSLTYVDSDGYRTVLFCQSAEEQGKLIRNLPTFKCRPDDVFICNPVKSGTHWLWEMISMMAQGRAETIRKTKVLQMLEARPQEELEQIPSPRILNTHVNIKYLPREALTLGCKIVFLLRNPKDLAVSLYHHNRGIPDYQYNGEWEHFLPLFLEGKTDYNSWFEYVLEWEELMETRPDLPIHVVYYEDLKEDPIKEIYALGKFLGIDNSDCLFEEVCEKCQFANMKTDKKDYLTPSGEGQFLHGFSFYRKGEVGGWKNRFTVAQSEMFDKIHNEKMNHSRLSFRYTKR